MPQQYMEFEGPEHYSHEYAGNTAERNLFGGSAGEKVNNKTSHSGFFIAYRGLLLVLSILTEIIAFIVMFLGIFVMHYIYDYGSVAEVFQVLLFVLFLLVTGLLIFFNISFARKR